MRSLGRVLPFLLLVACASPLKHVSSDPEAGALLFPLGSYIHEVKLSIPTNPDPSKRTFEFRGAVRIGEEQIRIVVLSPVGTTLLRMSEDRRTGKVTTENFVPQLKPYEPKLSAYYASLRVLLTTLRHQTGSGLSLDPKGRPLALEEPVASRPTKFTFADYDEHQIPTHLKIESEAFYVDVKVTGYEL